MKDRYILPLFVPGEGCPFRCIYCNQKEQTGQAVMQSKEEIREYIEKYLKYFKDKNKSVMLCFYGGSFTGIAKIKQLLYLDTAYEFIKEKRITELGLSTRPDYLSNDILNTLKQYNVTTIEIGAQSLADDILERSCRGHDPGTVRSAVELIHSHGMKCGIQLLPGLPGETDNTIAETVKKTIELKPEFARIYPVLVIKNTKLAEMYRTGQYTPLTLEKAVFYSEYMLRSFILNNILILRVGLHNDFNAASEKIVIAGPFHDSFGELVLSKYILKNIIDEISKYDKIYSIDILVGKGMLSAAVGHKKENVRFIREMSETEEISFIETDEGRYFTKVKVNKGESDIVFKKS